MNFVKRVAFINFWSLFDPENNFLINPLKKKFIIEVVDPKDADYVFFSVHGKDHFFVDDSKIKIFYTLENVCPDFNACDYAIGFEYLDYGDRYFRVPGYIPTNYRNDIVLAEQKHILPSDFSLKKDKTKFCCYTISNEKRATNLLKDLINHLDCYKKVDSGGRWNNNIGGPVEDKLLFDQQHKFSIAFENSSHPGYTTEKLIQAFAARTVPIYWGDPSISQKFNTSSFINIHDYKSILEVAKTVQMLDCDDELYLAYLQKPIYKEGQPQYADYNLGLESFLNNIFSQPIIYAKRRNREYFGSFAIDEGRKLALSCSGKGIVKLLLRYGKEKAKSFWNYYIKK